jgi:hypothetical protein
MRKIFAFAFAAVFTMPAFAAQRPTSSPRVGMVAAPSPASRMPNMTANLNTSNSTGAATNTIVASIPAGTTTPGAAQPLDCKTAYNDCMNQFCLLDESEGARCACSDNIDASKSKIKEIKDIQDAAEKLYTQGVEREKYGASASLVFADTSNIQSNRFANWLSLEFSDESASSLDEGFVMGDALYEMASNQCAATLATCGAAAEMEKLLYSRQIIADCRTFGQYLDGQKRAAEQNKAAAELAVRTARAEMLDTTNKYNRGQCLLAYKSCVSYSAGCGANFENCMDKDLLERRAHTCDNILDECMAVRPDVLRDWADEIGAPDKRGTILWQAAEFERTNKPLSCRSKTTACLEQGCSKSTNTMCLTDINIAAGICPVIDDCEAIVPGFKDAYKDELRALSMRFCENDLSACFAEKCGKNMSDPVCLNQDVSTLCRKANMPSCNGYSDNDFTSLMSFTIAKMKDAQSVMCINYIEETMGRSGCGTEMNCIAVDARITSLTDVPADEAAFKSSLIASTDAAVDKFFNDMMSESMRVAACSSATRGISTGTIFGEAKLLGKIAANQRMERAYQEKLDEISRTKSVEEARLRCDKIYADAVAQNSTHSRDEDKEGQWTTGHNFESNLRNCQLTQYQRVCEVSGESKGSLIGKNIAGGGAMGLAAGAGFGPIGAAIGGVLGIGGGAALGVIQGKEAEKPVCHTIGPIYVDKNV